MYVVIHACAIKYLNAVEQTSFNIILVIYTLKVSI